jgi:hypothetical protein
VHRFDASGESLGQTRSRPLQSSHAKYAAKVTSNVRQNCGHQLGTPGFDMTAPWARSNMPCAASAATTNQSDDLKPDTAVARKTMATSDSRTSACRRAHNRE